MTLWATTLRATTLFFGGPQSLGRIETMRAGSRTEPEPEFYKPTGAALLRLRSATGTINLIDDGDLYLTRNIDSSISALESATDQNRFQVLDNLLLEVQRCVDFYDSQLGKGSIRKMLVAPTRLDRTLFDEHLRNHLGMSVHPLDLNESFSFAEPVSFEKQSLCFAAVAAATEPLRE